MGEKTATDPPEKVPTTEKEIERIGDIIKNARGTWFVLLGSLVFAAITLASVKDVSFFITSEQTKLPLLGISVPITSFFWAGSLLVTALYTYLHLYLVQLWDALGEADARIGDKPLADVIHPWLVSDAALRVRDKRRGAKRYNPYARKPGWKNKLLKFEWWLVTRIRKCWLGFKYRWLRGVQQFKYGKRSSSQRGMSKIGNLVSVLLVWFLGLAVIFGFWWRSMPAHDIWLTGWLGVLLIWSIFICWRSGGYALARLGKEDTERGFPISIVTVMLFIGMVTLVRSHLDIWENHPRMRVTQTSEDCGIEATVGNLNSNITNNLQCPHFMYAIWDFVRPVRASLSETEFSKKPQGWKGYNHAKQEFREIWCKKMLYGSCTINPFEMDVEFPTKQEDKFEDAWEDRWKNMLNSFGSTDFRTARLDAADFWGANLDGADLSDKNLNYAVFEESEMLNVDLSSSDLRGARFIGTTLWDAKFNRAQLQNSNFSHGIMEDADFTGAKMHGVVLSFAEMSGTVLEFAQIHGISEKMVELHSTDVSESDFSGAALRFVDFTGAVGTNIRNFDKSFGDGSVELAGIENKPNGWCEAVLSDAQYWGRYQGWLEKHDLGESFDSEITKHPLIPFSEPCPE